MREATRDMRTAKVWLGMARDVVGGGGDRDHDENVGEEMRKMRAKVELAEGIVESVLAYVGELPISSLLLRYNNI